MKLMSILINRGEKLLGGILILAEVITKTYKNEEKQICQCDIFRNIEYIERAEEHEEFIAISKIVFPNVIILTQACDLQQDFWARISNKDRDEKKHDKYLISVLVAPLYNFEDFRNGEHLLQLKRKMVIQGKIKGTTCSNIMKNENKRYHYLKFDNDQIADSVIDFKHYFTVDVLYLYNLYEKSYVCSMECLYRELVLQRFANFLSRIGLPDT